jgi:hypothetical protein
MGMSGSFCHPLNVRAGFFLSTTYFFSPTTISGRSWEAIRDSEESAGIRWNSLFCRLYITPQRVARNSVITGDYLRLAEVVYLFPF